MATCLQYPDRIRKVHLTGVAADRSLLGHLTVESWKDHVTVNDNLHSFAWSVLLATYSPEFLQQWQEQGKLQGILEFVAAQNSKEGLQALLQQAHVKGTTTDMATKFPSTIQGQACVGSLDQNMAPVGQVKKLCEILKWESPTVLEGCGHAAPMEQPRQWRNLVLEFLNA